MTARHSRWLLAAVLLVHRTLLFARFGADLTALLRANPAWVSLQLQARDVLEAGPWASLWYLQQSPPLPNAVVAAGSQFLPWPVGVGWALVLLQVGCSLAIALLMTEVATRIVPRWAATLLGVLWLASPDTVVLEVTGLGQTFYENLAALGVTASVFAFLRWCETSDRRWAIALGVAIGLLALTRSSYGYYAAPVLFLMAWRTLGTERSERRLAIKQLLVCAALALSIQGAWALKNLAVFGHWTWPASTWGGASLAASLSGIGAGDDLAAYILAEPERYEPWFAPYVEDHGSRPWSVDWQSLDFCPVPARAHDRWVTQRLGGQNRPENSQCLRLVSEAYGNAALGLLLRRPGLLVEKLKLGYATYWFPIRYHGGQYLSLFTVDWRVERSLRLWRSARMLLAGELPEPAYVSTGTWPDTGRRAARLFTLDLAAALWWLAELVVLHTLVPIWVLAVAWRAVRRRSLPANEALVLLLALTFLYSAGLHNLVEFGENMRFRWNVEPVIWLLVAGALARLGRLVAQRRTRR